LFQSNKRYMRYAGVYETKNELIFCSNAQTTEGLNLSTHPYIHLKKESNTTDVVSAIQKVIASNQFGVPHPKQNEWGKFSKSHLDGLGMKSLAVLHKKASYCSINEDGESFIFCPTRNGGQAGGYEFLPDMNKSVPKSASPEQIVTALKDALRISTLGNDGNTLN